MNQWRWVIMAATNRNGFLTWFSENFRFSLCFGFGMLAGMVSMGLMVFQATVALAETAAPHHLTLEEIVVTDKADSDPMGTAVGVKKIEKGRNINIPDVLKAEPDIDLKRRTMVGDTADSLAIRGFSGNRIMLNINGRPVNASGVVGGYYIDWGTIPLDNIEKIEIIRGGSSVRYGNNALGGVVNVITKKPTETPQVAFFANYGGSDDIDAIQNYRLTHSYKVGPFGYALAGSYQKADPFLWNNDFEGQNMAASVALDMPVDGQLSLGFQYANSERGFIRNNRQSSDPDSPDFNRRINDDYPLAFGERFSPYSGSAFMPGPGATWDKTKYYFDVGYTQPIADALLSIKMYKNHEDRKEKNYSSSDVNNFYDDGELVLDREVESDRSYGGTLELSKPFGDHDLMIGAEHKVLAYGDTRVDHIDLVYNNAYWVTDADLNFESSSEGICWGYYIQDSWQISDRWRLTAGLRYDDYENRSINGSTLPELEDDALTPKLTASYRLTEKDTITGSIYQALRTPGLPESYWWAEGATNGHPTLKPETSNAAELVYRRRVSDSDYFRLSTYYYEIEDYIVSRFDPAWRGVYNIDKAKFYGASVDGHLTLTDWLSANAALTWQQSKKEGDIYDTADLTDEIDYMPEWKASAGLEFQLPFRSVFGASLRYVGERQAIYAYSSGWPVQQHFKLVELDEYMTIDLNLKVPVGKHTEISCYAENLFDEEYEEQFGYPMPGLIVGAAIKLSL